MKTPDSLNKARLLWDAFCSIKLTIFLLIVLAATSILGTVIPQQEGAIEFARHLSPWQFRLLSALQLFDMYHSTWFRVVIGLLALNLIVCSLDRLPGTLKLFSAHHRPDRSKPFESIPPHRTFSVKEEPQGVADRVTGYLRGSFKRLETKKTRQGYFFYGEKGRYALFGVYLVHLSVLLILTGAIVGSVLGFEAFVNIVEGESSDMVTLTKNRSQKWLGFRVECEKFSVSLYDSGAPREYRSELRFYSNGKELKRGSLLVNHPITFRGITFYQSSYGTTPGGKIRLRVSKDGEGTSSEPLEVNSGDLMPLPGCDAQFQVMEVDENLKGMLGPAALISVHPVNGEETRFWIFQNMDMLRKRFPPAMLSSPFLNPSAFEPYTFFLDEIESKYFTGLQVNRDPGVPFVWMGCSLMVAGFFITFFTSRRSVWVRALKDKGKIRISVAGGASKNPLGLEKELNQLTRRLQDLLREETNQ
jgi:cytochrome c biogenesis protein